MDSCDGYWIAAPVAEASLFHDQRALRQEMHRVPASDRVRIFHLVMEIREAIPQGSFLQLLQETGHEVH